MQRFNVTDYNLNYKVVMQIWHWKMYRKGHVQNSTMYWKWYVRKWISLCTKLDLVPKWIFCTENDVYRIGSTL